MQGSPMNCEPMTEQPGDCTEDAFLGGRLRLRQPKSGHRAGHDAILLAAATPAQSGDRVVDFGAGVGAAGLALARRVSGIEMILVEIDQKLADLARSNAALNGLPARVVVLDLASGAEDFAAAGLPPDSADAVLMNPPFNDPARHRSSPDPDRAIAHVAKATTLESWIHAGRRVLKSGGVLTLIWRAEALAQVLTALDRGFGSLGILPVHGDAATPAIRVLVRATKGGRAPAALYPGLMLNDITENISRAPHQQVRDILAGQATLPLAAR
jgi:tRNA1(Val) A37 N6-methylase TrmN6